MKSPAIRTLRRKLATGECVYGLWVTLESASITEMAVALGLDWIVIDAEHGHLDWRDIVEHLRATVRSDTVALVRIAELNAGLIKRALDIGADGVVVPWIETPDQLRHAVACAHYPPHGLRGIGAERATCWGQCFPEHVDEANENVLVVPIIESVQGGRAIDSLLDVPGVELFFFGPADFSSTAGFAGQWEGPGVAEAILAAAGKIRGRGKACGVVATDNDNLALRKSQGFRMLGIGLDAGLLLRSLRGSLATLERDRTPSPGFVLESAPATSMQPLERPPQNMRPDRPEVMTARGAGQKVELAHGVVFEMLVGKPTGARGLTTGIVTFAPSARLPYHMHAFGESITLLSGSATLEVEGRMYNLAPLDNVTVPRGLAHSAVNRSNQKSAAFHIALASDEPERELVSRFFPRRAMPDDSSGTSSAEHVTRFRLTKRYAPGAGASFVDYMNRELVPTIEMSGGYGLFQPGGRLPAHVHDFDESICIVQGTATCIVEGRRYTLGDMATALQPRGRVHYFINDSSAPMAMIWVYAGPMPERLVVDERCATAAGNPWQEAAHAR
jgi:2-keto-3-deoxy-L-rhamnonate aldolase RhmA/quercetin dioxygenase-like cupin family protein